MPSISLPFPRERLFDTSLDGQLQRSRLPIELAKECDKVDFLREYVQRVQTKGIGIPAYYPALSRKMRDLQDHNLIYPVRNGLYIHLYPDESGERDYYVPVQPDLTIDIKPLIDQVELRLLDWTEEIGAAQTDAEKETALLKALGVILTTTGRTTETALRLTPRQLQAVTYYMIREKVGFGVLAPLLLDPNIEDISCSGIGPIFIEHKIFKSLRCAIAFDTNDELDEFVIWMGEWIKRPVTVRSPIVDAVLPDGSRINIVYGSDISKRGSNFTIRKFSETPLSALELIGFNTFNYMMAAYLSFGLEEGLNVFVVGATASGKTTTLNAITAFMKPDAKIVTIEDTPELQVPHGNWIREQTRGGGKDDKASSVGMFDLLKAALRQRPDRIIIGEIRGEEGAIAFQAMQTGHGVMSTFHAASVEKLIQRLTGEPINIPKAYVDNLDLVVIQQAVRSPHGGMVRRVTSINEIVGYDSVSKTFSFIEAFRWNPATDEFDFPGYMNSFILEEKIAPKRGIPPFKRKAIYTDLKRRARIFERIHKERKVTGFYEFFQVLAEAHRQDLL
jgi:flagellar protein FlaI